MAEQLTREQLEHIKYHVERGQAILVLGAGIVRNCLNASKKPLMDGATLADLIAQHYGLDYNKEPLPQVIDAANPTNEFMEKLLKHEYQGCSSSQEMYGLFSYTWHRVYTFNIDDTLAALRSTSSQQTIHVYNALSDKVEPYESARILHAVQLHGYVRQIEKGYIFSGVQYDRYQRGEGLPWYQEFIRDTLRGCTIFIGTRLEEPIFRAELEAARKDSNYPKCYFVTPDEFTTIQEKSFQNRGFIHLRLTGEEFIKQLRSVLPRIIDWQSASVARGAIESAPVSDLTNEEVEALPHIVPVLPENIFESWRGRTSSERLEAAKRFILGDEPTWELASSEVPVKLEETSKLANFLTRSISEEVPFSVIVGQAGAGKTTATMTALLNIAGQFPNIQIIEIKPDVKRLSAALSAARKIFKAKRVVAFISDLYPFGRRIRTDIQNLAGSTGQLIAISRESEWASNFSRHLGDIAKVFRFHRFTEKDEPGIIEALDRYLSSPEFAKLSYEEKCQRLRSSRNQLLIAMIETTSSRNFEAVIEEEYRRLAPDAQRLMLISGAGTLARAGLSTGMAFSAYRSFRPRTSFDDAIGQLAGVVYENPRNRIFARHEVYVRHVFHAVASFKDISAAICSILDQFSAYRNPIIVNVGRLDAVVFRYLLNNDVIFEIAKSHDIPEDGLRIYQNFEIKFRLDGHFWLQYGLYFDRLGRLHDAQEMLSKSIEAFPENLFARHALARLQLRIAADRDEYDGETKDLIADAVKELNSEDASQTTETDTYPLMTLAYFHIDALVKHKQLDDAKALAREYHVRLVDLQKRDASAPVTEIINTLVSFVAVNTWRPKFR